MSRISRFEEIVVGDEAEVVHLLTQNDVQAFAALTGDLNPLHLEESFARKTSFRRPVVYGMLSASYISTLIGMLLPGQGALWTSQTLKFLHQAYVGDTLKVRGRVKQKSPATRMLVLEVTIHNQHAQELVSGESNVKMLELQEERAMPSDSTAQVILVTGSSGGIGAATAKKLAAAGHAVAINFRRDSAEADRVAADIAAAGGKAIVVQADVAQEADVARMVAQIRQELGPIDAVVHCAAPDNTPKAFGDLAWADFQEQIDVQVKGAVNCAHAVLPAMVEAKRGAMVLVGSVFTDGVPPPSQARYVVAKSALSALARSLAVEYGPVGIRVNVVSPGMTQTEMIAQIPEKAKLLAKMQTPLRRLAEPVDVANAIAFLLSQDASHISGETLRVCGGVVMV